MEGDDVQGLVDKTGMALPLAARIVALCAESGASNMEINAALDVARHLKEFLPTRHVPDFVLKDLESLREP